MIQVEARPSIRPTGLVYASRDSRAANAEAFLCAMASMEIIGFTPEALGNEELSVTNKFRTSQVCPSGFVAEVFADPPMRALPMM